MIKPPGFDPEMKYPVIIYSYGEPARSTVQNNWGGGDLWHQYLAQQGYIVMSLDPGGPNLLGAGNGERSYMARSGSWQAMTMQPA
jgi:dipeptidyl aminopeptidase/acylaminoacyl peptidase